MSSNLPAQNAAPTDESQIGKIINADFETGNLTGWKNWMLRRAEISNIAQAGKHAVALTEDVYKN